MSNIIYKAILSEKAYLLMDHGIYTFVVDAKAHKTDVKKAVESQFATKVSSVRLLAFPAKTKRVTGTRKTTLVGGGKKAIVALVKGEKIAMLSPKSEKSKTKVSKVKDESKEPQTKGKGFLSKIRRQEKTPEKGESE